MNKERCLHNVLGVHPHRCPYYDHDLWSCDLIDCPSHHPYDEELERDDEPET